MASKLPTTTNPDWLHNSHAGEILMAEFIKPSGIDVAKLAKALATTSARLQSMIDGKKPVDAELDLRLSRYFQMSEGFFLGLQNDYELLEAKRSLNGELDNIQPRAA